MDLSPPDFSNIALYHLALCHSPGFFVFFVFCFCLFFFFFCFKCSITPPSQSLVVCHNHPIKCILFFLEPKLILGLPRWLIGKEFAHQFRRCRLDPWVGKIPRRRKWQPTPVFLLGEIPSTKEPGRL